MKKYFFLCFALILLIFISGCTQTGGIVQRPTDSDRENLEQNITENISETNISQTNYEERQEIKNPCEGVVCKDSSKTCPDDVEISCQNTCINGTCTLCTPDCTGHEKPEETACTENWVWSGWSECLNGERTKTCTDQNKCSEEVKTETQECTPPEEPKPCEESWSCSDWAPLNCSEGETQTRTCTDSNNCGTIENKPNETQTCMPEPPSEEPDDNPPPDGLKPIINEIMYHPTQKDDYNEWIEIYNPSNQNINLTGWMLCGKKLIAGYVQHIEDEAEGELTNNAGLILKSHGFALITDGISGTDVYTNFNVDSNSLALHVDARTLCSRLTNTGKTVTLEDSSEETVNSVTYTPEMGANNNGKSLERKSDGSWNESTDGGTPGKINSP